MIMAKHLVIVEIVGGEIDDSTWELAQAARAVLAARLVPVAWAAPAASWPGIW